MAAARLKTVDYADRYIGSIGEIMPKKDRLSGWIWILAAVAAGGFVVLGSYLVQTHQRLKVVEIELDGAKEEAVRAKTKAAEFAEAVETLRLELKAANTARDEYQSKLDKADAAIAELSKRLHAAQSDLGEKQSQLQAMETKLEDAQQATDRAKAEAAEGEKQTAKLKEEVALLQSRVESLQQATGQAQAEAAEREEQIAKLRQGTANCEEFFNEWEVRGAPASLSAIAALGREAAAAKDCIDKGDVATACKHWQGLLVGIEKMGPPLSDSRGEIEELMRQHRCEAEGNPVSN